MNTLDLIKNRRSIDPDHFTGAIVEHHIIENMLEAANWAPTHGYTEPWRFIVYEGEKIAAFSEFHASLYQKHTNAEQFLQKKYEKLKNRARLCSHVIICINKRGDKSNIPALEEIAATSAAIQNMLLVATSNQVATFWSTGGMCYHQSFAEELGFTTEDQVLGILYVGKSELVQYKGKRISEWQAKVTWK